MKLYTSPASPFARKCRIVARELEIKLEEIQTDPWTDESFRRINPLAKIPVLILDDGSAIFDSPVICEYLDDLKNGHFFPRQSMWRNDSGRWRSLGLQAVGDGICDAAVTRVREGRLPEERRNNDAIDRSMAAVTAGLDVLERASGKFLEHPTIGEVTAGCTLGYLDFRLPNLEWRGTRPGLRAWFEKFSKFPSVIATNPANPT